MNTTPSQSPLPHIEPSPRVRPTFADVAMRVANDGPLYAVIALVGALAVGGHASSTEMVIASLGALLARSLPPGARLGFAGVAGALLVFQAATGIGAPAARASSPATTAAEVARGK